MERVYKYLELSRGFDFSGYRTSFTSRRIKRRMDSAVCADVDSYLQYLENNNDEIDALVNDLTINVSGFFRDSLLFEVLSERILPFVISNKIESGDSELRVWSAGCSRGEEPYSFAIIIKELLQKENLDIDINIFATDLNRNVLEKGKEGAYPLESVLNVKYGLLSRYFIAKDDTFVINDEIRNHVNFSFYDLLAKKTYAPEESIFGNFDIVSCQNVLIYFEMSTQETIIEKLFRSLNNEGYLILGKSELPPEKFRSLFASQTEFCHIYQKK